MLHWVSREAGAINADCRGARHTKHTRYTYTHARARAAVRAGAATHVPYAGLVIFVFFNKRAADNAAGPPVRAPLHPMIRESRSCLK